MLKKLWLAGVFLALSGLACTGAQPASQAPATAGDQPKYGGTFNDATPSDPFDYDMSYGGSTGINATFTKLGYSYLMRLKTGPDINYSGRVVEPLLAERWEVSPDATTFTFHLRKGVKFADLPPVNGRELTAADVKWSFEYMARVGQFKDAKLPTGQFFWMFEGLDSIQTPDPSTVVVKFKAAFAPFLYYASSSDNVIMPHEIYDQDGHFKDRVVGSGPFQADFAASQKGGSYLLKKNPTYFEKGTPYLDQVRILILPDEATRQAAFQTKQIDYTTTTDFRVAQEIRRASPDAVENVTPYTPIRFDLSWDIPPLNDFKVRKAISLALDRNELIKVLQGGEGKWALAGSNIFDELFTQEELKSFVKYDPAEAKRLLAEAGYPNGVTLEMRFATDVVTVTRGELMQAQLKKTGINLVLKPMPSEAFNAEKRDRKWQIYFLSEAPRSDLDSSLHLMVDPKGSFNYAGIDDPKINQLLAAQRREADPEKRREILRQLLRYSNESSILIPVWRITQYLFMQPRVQGWYHQADYRTIGSLWNTWLAK